MSWIKRLLGKASNKDELQFHPLMHSFMDVSMAMVIASKMDLNDQHEKIILAYSFGAIDYLGQKMGLDQFETLAAATAFYFKRLQLQAEESGEYAATAMQLSNSPTFSPYVLLGGQTMADWIVKEQTDAPMRLWHELSKFPS